MQLLVGMRPPSTKPWVARSSSPRWNVALPGLAWVVASGECTPGDPVASSARVVLATRFLAVVTIAPALRSLGDPPAASVPPAHPYFIGGELPRIALAILREAGEPLPILVIAARALTRNDCHTPDRRSRSRLSAGCWELQLAFRLRYRRRQNQHPRKKPTANIANHRGAHTEAENGRLSLHRAQLPSAWKRPSITVGRQNRGPPSRMQANQGGTRQLLPGPRQPLRATLAQPLAPPSARATVSACGVRCGLPAHPADATYSAASRSIGIGKRASA